MDINFTETYLPNVLQLDPSDVRDTRTRLSEYATQAFPNVENSPGTVLGDLITTPQSYIITALETGVERILSDTLLSNIANGQVYNCDFAKEYIKNFGIDNSYYYMASGVVRLIFSENKEYILQRGTQFRFGEYIFNLFLPNDGDFYCVPKDNVNRAGKNVSILKDTGSNTWFCDVPIVGKYNEIEGDISTEGQISTYIPELLSITSISDIQPGYIQDTLENLAKKAQITSFSASLNTRNGAIQYINTVCPFVQSVFPVKDGDPELTRTYLNGYGIASGCMDLYVRTRQYEFTENQLVRFNKSEDGEYLECDWDYVGQPYHIESITHPNVLARDIEEVDGKPREIISTSDSSLNLGAVAAYTQHEKLKIRIPIDTTTQDSIFNLIKDTETGQDYTYFQITYQTDPLLKTIADTVSNSDYTPIKVNILTRGFIPVIISNFEVEYVKKSGVIPNYEYAEEQIKIYLGNVGAPYMYSEAEIAKIMDAAGIQYMKTINVDAKVQWTVADKIQNLNGEIVTPPQTIIKSSDDLRIYWPSLQESEPTAFNFACSPRTVRYYLLENAIKFKEVRDV